MKLFLASLLFAASMQATAGGFSFEVLRGKEASIPSGDFGKVTAEWLPDGGGLAKSSSNGPSAIGPWTLADRHK